jgi:hypothetical protein
VHALKAFIDDSGSGGDSPWYVLAGYVGTAEAWDSFEGQWRAVLDGPPKLEYLKASEAESLRPEGQWAGVLKEQRNARIDSFIDVIGKHASRAIYVRLRQADFDQEIKPYVPPMWQNAYYFLFLGSMMAGAFAETYAGDGAPIEFFFDSKREVEKFSHTLYGQIAGGVPNLAVKVKSIHYEDEKLFHPLQAADLLAWQVRRRFCVQEKPRPQFEAAMRCPQPPFTHTMTREQLLELGETMDHNAMLNWALMGYPESMRKWKRPR